MGKLVNPRHGVQVIIQGSVNLSSHAMWTHLSQIEHRTDLVPLVVLEQTPQGNVAGAMINRLNPKRDGRVPLHCQ